MNEGLKEVGKGFITLANLLFVLFLLNTYIQKSNFNVLIVLSLIYGVMSLYYVGYILVNRGNKE